MKTLGLSDVIGPIMVGPSSSHTAGALRIAYMARRLCLAEPKTVEFRLLGSFAHTLTGHGTDKALVAGMLGLAADDLRIRDSFQLAGDAGLAFSFVTLPDAEYDHPNTIDMHIVDAAGNAMSVRGESIGGGAAVIRKIDDIDVRITGESTSIVVRQRDETGVLAHIAQSISDEGVNIATTRMYRERKGDIAYTVLETDQEVDGAAKAAIEDHPAILDVRVIPGDARPGCGSVDAPDAEEALQRFAEADFGTGAALLAWCEKHGTTLSEAFLAREAALAESLGYADRSLAYLHETLDVMKCAAQRPIDEALPSMGGLIGGEARKLADLRERDGELCDDQLSCAWRRTRRWVASWPRPRLDRLACCPACCWRCSARAGCRMAILRAAWRRPPPSGTSSRATPRYRARKAAARPRSARPPRWPRRRRLSSWAARPPNASTRPATR